MSDQYYPSKLLTNLKFRYSEDSVIRFYSRKHNHFFAAYGLEKSTVVKLINYGIENFHDQFYVSYFCYKSGIELYITHTGLQAKSYWFNSRVFTEVTRQSNTKLFMTVSVPIPLIESVDALSVRLNESKGSILAAAIVAEFNIDNWVKGLESGEASKYKLIDILKNDLFIGHKPLPAKRVKKLNIADTDWAVAGKKLIEISGEEYSDIDNLNQFIIDLKRKFQHSILEMKDNGTLQKKTYVVKAVDIQNRVLSESVLPFNFDLTKADTFFEKNIEFFAHTYYLKIYDPFIDNEFIFYPNLTNYMSEDGSKRSNFSIPKPIYDWLLTFTNGSERVRSSVIIQALNNALLGWQKEISSLDDSEVLVLSERLKHFIDSFTKE